MVKNHMNQELPEVVSEEVWKKERIELLEKEKAFTKAKDELNTMRRMLPMVEVEKDYTFDGPDGKVHLGDLFQGRPQLIVQHFMFDPEWDAGCPACSLAADNIGHLSHLHARNTSLVLISRAPFEKLERYKKRMGWSMPWYSSFESEFNYDYHATLDEAVRPFEYNYADKETHREKGFVLEEGQSIEVPGFSVFLREGDKIFHTYSTYARGADILLGTFNYLDLTAFGRQEDWEKPEGRSDGRGSTWLHRHDEYSGHEKNDCCH
ncbi:DUF899 domain-containing protein [Corticicoccus populi]|uniref:DUF899 domain-containing protein n=1 Tax=Corticicoccus populi TaxID=1812821 RepID=A0ABW5WWD7_9STAP